MTGAANGALPLRATSGLAEGAEAAGRRKTPAGAWQRAALAWHWGKFVFVDHPDEQRAAHDRCVSTLPQAAALSPPAEPVQIPYAGTRLARYLRLPEVAGAPPVVIMVPGLDSTKEELQATAEYFLARGLATLAIDGPGQGESEYELPIEPAYEKVVTAAVDYLASRDDLDDSGNVGLFGVSLGGYFAARGAAYEKRMTATVALAGPYRFDLDWDDLPPQTRATFRHRSGAASEQQARARAARSPSRRRPADHAPAARRRRRTGHHRPRPPSGAPGQEAPGAELVIYPDGSHGVTNHAYESRPAWPTGSPPTSRSLIGISPLAGACPATRRPGPVRRKRRSRNRRSRTASA